MTRRDPAGDQQQEGEQGFEAAYSYSFGRPDVFSLKDFYLFNGIAVKCWQSRVQLAFEV